MRNKTESSARLWSPYLALFYLYIISGPWSRALYYIDISSYNGPITALNTIRPAIDRKYIKRKYHLPRKSPKQQTEDTRYIRAGSVRNVSSLSFYSAIFLEDTGGISLPIVHLFLKVLKTPGNFPDPRKIPENNLFSLVSIEVLSLSRSDRQTWLWYSGSWRLLQHG